MAAVNLVREFTRNRPEVSSPDEVAAVVWPMITKPNQEHLIVLGIDAKSKVRRAEICHIGGVSFAAVNCADILRSAVTEGYPQIIVAHNHPSGDPTPSPEDVSITRQLKTAAQLFDIAVLDHVIIGDNEGTREYRSLHRMGLM